MMTNKNIYQILKDAVSTPAIYAKTGDRFWDDEHISGQMLNLHLNPDVEAASKTRATIAAESQFIIETTAMSRASSVLDLGCGPGLYVREFARTGAHITGIDLSQRSIDHARASVMPQLGNASFIKMNYLELDFQDSFDIATLIFYDFCALNPDEQEQLLEKIHTALKPGGWFAFDVVTENRPVLAGTTINSYDGGFWSPGPHVEIVHTTAYEEPLTEGMRYTIIEDSGVSRVINLYHRLFSLKDIASLLENSGFRIEKVFSNLQGGSFDVSSQTYGVFARRAG